MPMIELSRRRLLALLTLAGPGAALAQTAFPSRAIRVIVPWPPGGLVDTGGRVVAEALIKAFGQGAAVENLAGAAGTLGADQVAKAAADGHTLLMATSSIAIDVAGQRRMAFDPVRDLAPVALVADTQSVVVVPVSSPIKTLAAGFAWPAAILLGITTAVGGTVLRDLLVGRVPTVFGGSQLYATPALLASTVALGFHHLDLANLGMIVAALLGCAFVVLARWRRWQLPMGGSDLSASLTTVRYRVRRPGERPRSRRERDRDPK